MVANAGYWSGHRWLVSVICIIGVVTNVLNIIVWSKLSRRDRNKPMHILFLWLSIIDLLVVLCYGIFDLFFFWITRPVKEAVHSEPVMYLVLIGYTMYVVFYTASKWMAVALSIFRAVILFCPLRRNVWCSSCRAHLAASCVVICAVVLWGIPIYIFYTVTEISNSTNGSSPSYWLTKREIAQTNQLYHQIMLWVYGVVFEILPVILLSVLSVRFIVKLCQGQNQDSARNPLIPHNDGTRFTVLLAILAFFYVFAGLTMGIYALYFALTKKTATDLYYFMDNAFINNFTDPTELLNCSLAFVFYFLMYPSFKRETRSVFRCNRANDVNIANINEAELPENGAQVNVNNVERLRNQMF